MSVITSILLEPTNFTTILVFIVTFLFLYLTTSRPSGVPRGPIRLPLLGNLLSLIGPNKQEIFEKLRQRYGDVYGLYIGSELNVVLNGYDVINEVMLKKGSVFAHRPKVLTITKPELVFANGPGWKQNRAFVMQAFRDLCFVNKGESLETYILEELREFEELLDKLDGPFSPPSYLSRSLANVMFTICHGYRAGYDSKQFLWYLSHVEEAIRIFARSQIINKCLPILKHIPGDVLYINRLKKGIETLKNYFDEICKDTFSNHAPGDRSCLTDILLEEDSTVQKDRIWVLLHEVMAAGSETTATVLSWFLMLIAMYPDVQSKLREQVLSRLGEHEPSLTDRGTMPYVEATMLECLRIGSVVPLSVPHTVIQDVQLRGYTIPKDCVVLPNLASVNMDPHRFPEPRVFKPERFLTDDGLTVVGADDIIPFSLGPRACLGETIARIELFMYIVYIVQKYDINLATKPASMAGILGLTHKPQPYEITLNKRHT